MAVFEEEIITNSVLENEVADEKQDILKNLTI